MDIVAIISEYLTLKKSGVTYKALCPFHIEKTPSFTVSPERGTWHCFGCGDGGDVISFVQKIDGLEFNEALERLANRAGIELKPLTRAEAEHRSDKVKVADVMELATGLYHQILINHPSAKGARDYLVKRGVSDEMAAKFKLGYAPNAWHTVEQMLIKKNLALKWAVVSGLSIAKTGGGFYDRFRGRLLFPIDDPSGKIVGFTGRVIEDQPDAPKYLNTSESPVFKKSEALYAISFAKSSMKQADLAVMMEGQMDVITAHQFGFTNAVATSGTAVTNDHLRILKRYTENVAFAFDSDAAGLKAARAAVTLALSAEMNPMMIAIPHGKDPDECIRYDKSLWQRAVDGARPAVEYFIDYSIGHAPQPLTALAKKTIVQQVFPLIETVKNAVEQADYLAILSRRLGVPQSSVISDFGNRDHKSAKGDDKDAEENNPLNRAESFDLERQTIGLMLTYFDQLHDVPGAHLENQALDRVYQLIKKNLGQKNGLEKVLHELPTAWQKRLDTIVIETIHRHEELEASLIDAEIKDSLARLTERDRDLRISANAQAIAAAFAAGDKDRARALLKSLDSDTINMD